MPDPTPGDLVRALEGVPPIHLEVDAGTASVLLSALQLACRHPGLRGTHILTVVVDVARRIQDAIAGHSPEAGRLMERGWHECFDVERRPT